MPSISQKKDKLYGLLAGILVAIGWGSIGLWIQEISLPATEIATYRFLGAGLFLTLISSPLYKRQAFHFSTKKILASGLCGIVLALQFICTIVAYQKLLAGEATVVTNLHLFVILFAYSPFLFRQKKALLSFSLGCFLLLLGLYLLFIEGRTVSLEVFGILIGLCSSLLFGAYTLLSEKFFSPSPQHYLGLIFIFGSIPLLAYLLLSGGFHLSTLSPHDWFFLSVLLILSTIIAHISYLLTVKWLGAMGAGILAYFAILIAFLIDFFSGKPILLSQWLGALLLFGVLIGLQNLNQKINRARVEI